MTLAWPVALCFVALLGFVAFLRWLRTAELHTEAVKNYEAVVHKVALRIEKLEQWKNQQDAGKLGHIPPMAARRGG